MGVVFGICFIVDKLFTKMFRGTQKHQNGKTIRLNKKYGSIGLIMFVLGLSAIFAALPNYWLLLVGGCVLSVTGAGLVMYYMSFGIFYDDDGFLLSVFGRKSKIYRYGEICEQRLYTSYNNLTIELYFVDGRSVQLQATMRGMYSFLDKAALAYLAEYHLTPDSCDFYDPENSKWFPEREEK